MDRLLWQTGAGENQNGLLFTPNKLQSLGEEWAIPVIPLKLQYCTNLQRRRVRRRRAFCLP